MNKYNDEANTIALNLYSQLNDKLMIRRTCGEYVDPDLCEAKEITFEFEYYQQQRDWQSGKTRRIITIHTNTNVGYLGSLTLCTTPVVNDEAVMVSKPFFKHVIETMKAGTTILPSRRQLKISNLLK